MYARHGQSEQPLQNVPNAEFHQLGMLKAVPVLHGSVSLYTASPEDAEMLPILACSYVPSYPSPFLLG